MSTKAPLGLPSITPELKTVIPYLQRAEEVRAQEPIVAYWCAYYAAQLGIGIKTKDGASRNILLELLGFLEKMKQEIGSSEAIEVDAVGSAYVENFAMKVFTAADNEDRGGRASRLTAKKFLAAGNFLEVLKTFNKAELSEANTEKIRYAKWKAADIAKAFREGRKPAPGPPGFSEEQDIASQLAVLGKQGEDSPALPSPPSQPAASGRFSPERPSHRARSRTPPLDIYKATSTSRQLDDEWSTIVAPNASILDPPPSAGLPIPRRSSGDSLSRRSASRSPKRRAFVSDELEGKRSTSTSPKPCSPAHSNSSSPTRHARTASGGSDKKVHFTPSVVGGSVTTSSSQPGSPQRAPPNLPSFSQPPTNPGFPNLTPSAPPLPPPAPSSPPYKAERRSPPRRQHPLPPPAPSARVVLTPAVILQAQKYCRLASSALDYEDAETAKRELRAALALLGE